MNIVHRSLRPKWALPHSITIKNMRFNLYKKKLVNNPFKLSITLGWMKVALAEGRPTPSRDTGFRAWTAQSPRIGQKACWSSKIMVSADKGWELLQPEYVVCIMYGMWASPSPSLASCCVSCFQTSSQALKRKVDGSSKGNIDTIQIQIVPHPKQYGQIDTGIIKPQKNSWTWKFGKL